MSLITLQYGQCGNQLGSNLFSVIYDDIKKQDTVNEYNSRAINTWFNLTKAAKWEARAILVDTETKVVDSRKSTPYIFKQICARSFGSSANNWAYGYNNRGNLLVPDVLNSVRIEVEKCDYLSSFLNILSSSGGTGSGVGSKIIEHLSETYPKKTVTSAIVLPYMKGEVVTQTLNTLLTLSKLSSVSDSNILVENDRIHYSCSNYLGVKEHTYGDLNRVIAQQLAAVFQPLDRTINSFVLSNLSCHPKFKFLQMRSAPYITDANMNYESLQTWKALLCSLSKQSRFDMIQQSQASRRIVPKNVASALITRGGDMYSDLDLKPLRDPKLYVPWLALKDSFNAYHQKRSFYNYDKFLVHVTNSNNVCVSINEIIKDAWRLFTHGAYIHHYKKYETDEKYFLEAFQTAEDILANYQNLE